MSAKGWIRLHRKIRDNPVFNDFQLYRLWTICLTEASHKEHSQVIGKQVVKLLPGEFLTGRFDLHEMYNKGLKRSERVADFTVWRWLQTLEKHELLSINSSNKFTVVTVVNWRLYQDDEQESVQQNVQQVSNKCSTSEQQVCTNKNGKNVNNDNNDKKVKKTSARNRIYPEDSSEYRMASYLHSKIMENAEGSRVENLVARANLQKWADDCRKLLEINQVDKELIKEVIDWVTAHDFWKTNILSPSKLREKFQDLAIKMELERKGGKSGGKKGNFGNKPTKPIIPIVANDPAPQPSQADVDRALEMALRLDAGRKNP